MTDESGLDRLLHRDHHLPSVTAQAVGEALSDFPLPLRDGVSLDWVAAAVRRGLSFTVTGGSNDPKRLSNAKAREHLRKSAEKLRSAWQDAFNRGVVVDDLLFRSAFMHSGARNALGVVSNPDFEYNRIGVALEHLDWLASFFEQAALEAEPQPKNWSLSEGKEWRIARGQVLASVYERAFGQNITVNRHGQDPRFTEPTAFMTFYLKMVKLAFVKENTSVETNLPEVLQEAKRRHLADPWPL